jgi:hypothetical protein
MGYIVFSVADPLNEMRSYKSEKGAKIATTRSNNKAGSRAFSWCEEREFGYRFLGVKRPTVEVSFIHPYTSKMVTVEILEEDRGTVNDPSTERHWTM